MVNKENRISIFDNLRFIAIISVLFIHLTGWFLIVNQEIREPYVFFARASRFAVPMFVFISASLFILKYKKTINIKSYYIGRFIKIVMPYFLISVAYYIYRLSPLSSGKLQISFTGWDNFFNFGKLFFTTGVFSHLYFVPMIITFYFFAPLIAKFFKKYKYQTATLLAAFNILFVVIMNNLGIEHLYWRWLIFPYLIYVALGFLFADVYKKITKLDKKIFLLPLLLVMAGIAFIYKPYNSGSLELYGFSSYLYDSFFGAFWVLVFLSINFSKKLKNIVSYLSKKSFGIYLFHYLFIDLIFSFINKGILNIPFNITSYFVLIIMISGLSIMSFWIVEKTVIVLLNAPKKIINVKIQS